MRMSWKTYLFVAHYLLRHKRTFLSYQSNGFALKVIFFAFVFQTVTWLARIKICFGWYFLKTVCVSVLTAVFRYIFKYSFIWFCPVMVIRLHTIQLGFILWFVDFHYTRYVMWCVYHLRPPTNRKSVSLGSDQSD